MSLANDARAVLAGLIGALSLVGFGCGPAASVPVAGVYADVSNEFFFGDGSYFVRVDVVVSANQPFQAYDLEIQWNPSVVYLVEEGKVGLPQPHPEFDDDGALFAPVVLNQQAGSARGIVDLRHGGNGLAGDVRVARAWFHAPAGGQASIQVSGTVSTPTGEPFVVLAGKPLLYP